MKIAVLWTRESGYLAATLKAATDRGHDVKLFSQGMSPAAPFSGHFDHFRGQIHRNSTAGEILAILNAWRPDAIVVAGWHIEVYRRIAGAFRGRAQRILSMDNQWHGTPRQRLGQLAFRTVYANLYDAAIVPGKRQREFATRLGFRSTDVLDGSLCADVSLYSSGASDPEPYFLYVGRNAPEKNLPRLLTAYAAYRARADRPWRLTLAGVGDFAAQAVDGLDVRDFVQPPELSRLMGSAGAFVLPSIWEPWGVVLQEAAAAGRYLLASTACGGADAYVLNGINGVLFDPQDVEAVIDAMFMVSLMPTEELRSRGTVSQTLAKRFESESWSLAVEAVVARTAQRREIAAA